MIKVLALWFTCSGLALAQEAEDDTERVTGKAPPPLKEVEGPRSPQMDYELPNISKEEYANRPYAPSAYIGAHLLKMDPEFVHLIQEGMELVYLRKYEEAREHFVKVEEKFPKTGLAAVADVLVWQALMLENFDLRFDKQYWVSTKAARADLEAALSVPGNEGWENFLMAGVVGVESIHTMRQTKYLPALQLAFNAMDHIQKAREGLPDFPDLLLADGMYNYWRSVVTLNSSVLPDFGDHRTQGIEQMQTVETRGIFLKGPATLSLAFTWLEEGNLKNAISACVRNKKKYPDNIINNLVTGSTYISMNKYDTALEVFDEILVDDPNNRRVHYWRGLALMRSNKLKEAEKAFNTYLAFDSLEAYQRASTYYRLGQLQQRREDYAGAMAQYKEAIKLDGHKGAEKAKERLEEMKKAGTITF